MLCQETGDLARGPALVRFDLEDQGERTSHPVCKFLLCQVEGLASVFDPGAEGMVHKNWLCQFLYKRIQGHGLGALLSCLDLVGGELRQ